ncbi:unnamed protein product [Ilex paraguariensis]|uniref:Uncharacterized protein n=1 Tax=Ilex paraguariensis TaxID=185542 RepID=A0ABC8SN77_9AQUA
MIKPKKEEGRYGKDMLQDLRIAPPFSIITKVKWITWEPPAMTMMKLNVDGASKGLMVRLVHWMSGVLGFVDLGFSWTLFWFYEVSHCCPLLFLVGHLCVSGLPGLFLFVLTPPLCSMAWLVLLLLPAVLLPLFFDAACPGLELLCSSGFQLYCSCWDPHCLAYLRWDPVALLGIMDSCGVLVGSGLKGTAHVTAHGTAPVNSVNARSRIGNCNRLSKPGIGCPCGGEFAADDCWLDGYHEDSAPRPSY